MSIVTLTAVRGQELPVRKFPNGADLYKRGFQIRQFLKTAEARNCREPGGRAWVSCMQI